MSDLAKLPRDELEHMAAAGQAALACLRSLSAAGKSVVSEAIGGAECSYEWQHYPEGDMFLRPLGMPAGVRPLMLPELAIPDAPAQPQGPVLPPARQPNQGEDNDKLSHLVAISMDACGLPVRLFTTNRWVTGETWYGAEDVMRMLDRFAVDRGAPSRPLNGWITDMFTLFRPQMRALLAARDAAIMSWRRRHRGKIHVFEDRRLEVTSAAEIDIEDQVQRVEAALRRAA